jgi:hypothetical protein
LKPAKSVDLRLLRGLIVAFADEESFRAAMNEKSDTTFGQQSGASNVTEVVRAALDQRYETVALEKEMCGNLVGRNHLNSSLSEALQLTGVHIL